MSQAVDGWAPAQPAGQNLASNQQNQFASVRPGQQLQVGSLGAQPPPQQQQPRPYASNAQNFASISPQNNNFASMAPPNHAPPPPPAQQQQPQMSVGGGPGGSWGPSQPQMSSLQRVSSFQQQNQPQVTSWKPPPPPQQQQQPEMGSWKPPPPQDVGIQRVGSFHTPGAAQGLPSNLYSDANQLLPPPGQQQVPTHGSTLPPKKSSLASTTGLASHQVPLSIVQPPPSGGNMSGGGGGLGSTSLLGSSRPAELTSIQSVGGGKQKLYSTRRNDGTMNTVVKTRRDDEAYDFTKTVLPTVEVELGSDLKWKFTPTGMPYIADQDGNVVDLDGAQDPSTEHVRPKVGFFSPQREVVKVYGPQINQYFNFMKFIVATNLIFTIIAFISYGHHLRFGIPRMDAAELGPNQAYGVGVFDFFFISSYQPSSDDYWIAMVVLSTIFSFCIGPLYIYFACVVFRDDEANELQYVVEDRQGGEGRTGGIPEEDCLIQANKHITRQQRIPRIIASYCVFIVCLLVPLVIMWALLFETLYQFMQGEYDAQTRSLSTSEYLATLLSALVSLTVTTSNALFGLIVSALTAFEGHKYWSSFRTHRLFKLIVFRLVNIVGLLCLRYYADVPWFACMTSRMGYQVLIFIILDATVMNVLEILYPIVMTWYRKWRGPGSGGDMDQREEFELSDEYLEIVFRQFYMYIGITVFPMVTLMTLIANIIEFALDKWRLINLCKKPVGQFTKGSYKIGIFLGLAALAALFSFPLGPVWYGPPLGPYLCWPCTSHAAVQSKDGGVCMPQFEPLQCPDNMGGLLPEYAIRDKLAELQSGNAALSSAADQWFNDNQQLFNSRRCGCRPCLTVMTCACSAPVVRACEAIPERTCGGVSQGIACTDDSSCTSGSTCQTNLEFTEAQCTKTRDQYSVEESKAHTALCIGGTNAGNACERHEDCTGGSCDLYCPRPREDGGNTGEWDAIPQCWNCPEVKTSSLVSPMVVKKSWEKTSFCNSCTLNSCICSDTCSI